MLYLGRQLPPAHDIPDIVLLTLCYMLKINIREVLFFNLLWTTVRMVDEVQFLRQERHNSW